jgi:hypothetical protein
MLIGRDRGNLTTVKRPVGPSNTVVLLYSIRVIVSSIEISAWINPATAYTHVSTRPGFKVNKEGILPTT